MSPRIRVYAMPDGRAINPYQKLLADALAPLGAVVTHPKGYRRVLPLARAVLDGEWPDVLHLHWPNMYLRSEQPVIRTAYCIRILADVALVRSRGIPVVWTLHNLVTHDTATPGLELWFGRRLAAQVDHIIAHSDGAKREAVAQFKISPDKITVVPHGRYGTVYGAPVDRVTARARLGMPAASPMALFFGTVRPYKGVLQLLEAWPRVSAERGDAVLRIAGYAADPDYQKAVERCAEGQPSVVLTLNYVPDKDVATLLSAADILVLPYKDSLTSGTLALATTYDVPVVTPKYEGTAGMTRGVFARSTAPEDLSDAMSEALAMAGEPRTPHAAADDWVQIAQMHRDVFAQCLRRRRGCGVRRRSHRPWG